jgi:hypothetical protein
MSAETFLQERRNDAETGTTVSLWDTTHPGNDEYTEPDDKRWAVCCDDHDIYQTFDDRGDAQALMAQSLTTWCSECATEHPGVTAGDEDDDDEDDDEEASAPTPPFNALTNTTLLNARQRRLAKAAQQDATEHGHGALRWQPVFAIPEPGELIGLTGTGASGDCPKCRKTWFIFTDASTQFPTGGCTPAMPHPAKTSVTAGDVLVGAGAVGAVVAGCTARLFFTLLFWAFVLAVIGAILNAIFNH